MTARIGRTGVAALMVAHCAGMVDLVALPVWVGTLMQHRKLDPQQAGGLVTLFLAGAVLASLVLAPRLARLPVRGLAASGFALAAACFAMLIGDRSYAAMAALHGVAGLAAGASLSVTHGTIARSANPHRLFALVGMALGVFAVIFLGAASKLVQTTGGSQVMFGMFTGVMAVAAVVAMAAFPRPDGAAGPQDAPALGRIPRTVWYGVAGISAMALVQSMTFSFLERVGRFRGFEADAITAVLVVLGLVNLLPAVLAALLEKRWPAHRVLLAGPAVQALLCVAIMSSAAFGPYAAAASVFAAVMIFTHTFAFGLLARLDPSGRALAATPAMLMAGAAVGPILGGTLVKAFGYEAIGVAAAVIAVAAVLCFLQLRPRAAAAAAAGASA
jgi:predicted MFS family arabinose efflux permease